MYIEQWNALAARIRSLREAANLYAQFLISRKDDNFGVGSVIGEESRSVFEELKTFRQSFDATLPPNVRKCLDKFLNERPAQIIKEQLVLGLEVKAGPVLLTAFEAEMSFLLSDAQEVIRARSERAFLHLQRLLAVDDVIQDRWKTAFNAGETACEKLGDVHLLWHGIFAFKINAQGARTDLIFSEPIDASLVQKGVEGLVLTEWKVADERNAARRFEEARKQAALYQRGALVGTELTGYRYAVVVSRTELSNVPDNLPIGGVIYRHINIAITPRSPSVQARTSDM
jgi:hypothetical protein